MVTYLLARIFSTNLKSVDYKIHLSVFLWKSTSSTNTAAFCTVAKEVMVKETQEGQLLGN